MPALFFFLNFRVFYFNLGYLRRAKCGCEVHGVEEVLDNYGFCLPQAGGLLDACSFCYLG